MENKNVKRKRATTTRKEAKKKTKLKHKKAIKLVVLLLISTIHIQAMAIKVVQNHHARTAPFHFPVCTCHAAYIPHFGLPCGAFFFYISHSHACPFRCTQLLLASIRIKSIFPTIRWCVWWTAAATAAVASPLDQVISCPEKRALHKLHKNSFVQMVLCRWAPSTDYPVLHLSLTTRSGYRISARARASMSNSNTNTLCARNRSAASPKQHFCYQIHYPQIRMYNISESTHISFRIDCLTAHSAHN